MTWVRCRGRDASYSSLADNPFGLQCAPGANVVVHTDDAMVVVSAFASLEGKVAAVHLVPLDQNPAQLGVEEQFDEQRRNDFCGDNVGRASTTWTLYTSGTTGVPKPVVHTLDSLSRTVVPHAGGDLVWGLLYDPTRMAGVQVLLQAWRSNAPLVAADPGSPLRSRIDELVAGQVNALSATPTLWRQILQIPASSELGLRQITLGGEIADQRILDGLRARFPDARIVHVFAATETGAAFSVSDGKAGFPRRYLDVEHNGIRLAVRSGELYVFAPGVDIADDDGFVGTGDLVEVTDDRVIFLGRGTGVINIGGANVWPEQVEQALRDHPLVAEVSVTARQNSMSGHLLVASVVLTPGNPSNGAGREIRKWARAHLPSYQVPATVTVVESLDVSSTGKVKR